MIQGLEDTDTDQAFLALLQTVGEGQTTVRPSPPEREFFLDNPLVRIHFVVVMIRWTGLAPWEFEFPLSGSLTSTFL